ncbi:MAG: 3'-5' exonuclease [Sarcina sp.]
MLLNEKQKIVVETLDRNIILTSSAGTGKTAVLTERIYNILNKKLATEEEILSITFTNKAAKEMKSRIEERLGGSTKSTIKTFHSFCLEIIRSNAKDKTDIPTDFVVVDEEDARDAVRKISAIQAPGYDRTFIDIAMIHKFIDKIKEHRIKTNNFTEDEEVDYKNSMKNLEINHRDDFDDCFKSEGHFNRRLKEFLLNFGAKYVVFYNKQLRSDKSLDFNDLVSYAKILFNEDDVVNYYRAKYKFINIDEVQDTSFSDYELIEKLFKDDKEKNILLCGDRFQTIYKWRGSEPDKIFESFKKSCNPIEIAFDKNYRSTKILTRAANDFLKNSFGEKFSAIYKDEVTSCSKEDGEKIKVIDYGSTEAEAIGILNEFKLLEKQGEDLSKVAVLTRLNNYNKELSKTLARVSENEDFQFILVDEYKFFRRSEIKDITALFKVLANRDDALSLERILKRLNTGIGKAILDKMKTREFRLARIKLSDFISDYTASGEFYSNLLNAYDKSEDGNIVVFDVESTGTDITTDEIIQIAAIKIDSKGNILDSYERFIKPNKSVGASAKVHGFTDEFLQKNGLSKEEVLKEFREYTKDKIIVGHNVQYDINIFTSELSRANIGAPLFKGFYDTLDIYRRFYPASKEYDIKNYKLEHLSEVFKTNHKPSHNAMDDITTTKELLVMAIEDKIRASSFERIALIGDLYRSFEEFRVKFRRLLDKSYELRPFELINEIEKEFNILNKYPQEEREERYQRVMNFKKILSVLDDKEKSSRDALIGITEITALSGGEIEEIISSTEEKPRIPIITVHQAKGLEYDTVIVSGLVEGKFPIYRGDFDEEGKLFYVAITRAKKRLILTYPSKGISKYGKEYDNNISPFIETIDKEFFEFKK